VQARNALCLLLANSIKIVTVLAALPILIAFIIIAIQTELLIFVLFLSARIHKFKANT
jgi:hypothetical protein